MRENIKLVKRGTVGIEKFLIGSLRVEVGI